MTSKYQIFWALVIGASLSLAACGQKKEENKGRPPVPPGATAGQETGGTGAGTTSVLPVVVSGNKMQLTVSDIRLLPEEKNESTPNHLTLTASLNGTTRNISLELLAAQESVSYFVAGDYVVTHMARCDSEACSKLYFVAWVSDTKKGIQESQIGLVKFLDGKTFSDGKDQFSLAILPPAKMIESTCMTQRLDGEECAAKDYP